VVTSGTTFGSGARLKMTATTTSSSNKFSILGIDGTPQFVTAFDIKLDGGSISYHRFAIGRDGATLDQDGVGTTQFSNNLNFGGATLPTFLIMQWNLSASDVYTLRIQKKDKTDLFLDPTLNPGISFIKGGEYRVQIYANNSAASSTYVKGATTYTVTSGSSHIWINNVQLIFATGNANFTTGELAVGQNLNAMMFLSVNPSSPAVADNAVAYVDDLLYANYMTDLVKLPIELTDFKAVAQTNSIKLNWTTATETNNSHFELLRSKNATNFSPITTVKGSGTTQTQQHYSFIDYNPLAGTSYYQLKQIDNDGNSSTSNIIAVKTIAEKAQLKVVALPEQRSISFVAYAEEDGQANVRIVDLAGKKLIDKNITVSKGYQTIKLPADLQKGVYILSLKIADAVNTAKFIF